MGWFDAFESFANGTLLDDTMKKVENGIDQLEKFANSGEETLQSVVNVTETAADKLKSGTDKVVNVADVVNEKLQ